MGGPDSTALFLNQRGGRLGARGAHDVIVGITSAAGLDDEATAHLLRHTFATTLVRGGSDLVTVAELLGHARLETTATTPDPVPKTGHERSTCSPSTAEPGGTPGPRRIPIGALRPSWSPIY